MPRRLRFSLANTLLAATCIALAIGWWWTAPLPSIEANKNSPPSMSNIRMLPLITSSIQTQPLTIAMSESPGKMPSWYFSVNSAGDGELSIPYRQVVQPVEVNAEQLKQLRDLLAGEQFFTLDEDYGETDVVDGDMKSLAITVGQWTQRVRIHSLDDWVAKHDTAKLRDPARALRVWMLIRTWFNHLQAANFSKDDQAVLDAVKAPSKTGG